MRTDDLDYELPPELIAQEPPARRENARLMVLRDSSERFEHLRVSDLPGLLCAGDLLVLNDTRVIPARFYTRRAKTGGSVEGLFLEADAEGRWRVMLRSGGTLTPGEVLELDDARRLELVEKLEEGDWLVRPVGMPEAHAALERFGVMPLPPYIGRAGRHDARDAMDRERYQTVYADAPGAVAAPTAGLHFTVGLLEALRARGVEDARVTLHVGAGTFAPVRTATLEEHRMHAESFAVPGETIGALRRARTRGGRIIPIGTTSVRALESLPEPLPEGGFRGRTRLLIQPGFRFRYCDGLLTNFHLPRSTLLALVAARIGLQRLRSAYREAVSRGYRFYSYGDAMLVLPD